MKKNNDRIQIEKNKNTKINPDFIYNRFDLFEDDFITYKVIWQNKEWNIECYVKDNVAHLGMWLMDANLYVSKAVFREIFKNKKIKKIEIVNSLIPYGSNNKENHFKIDLPSTEKELADRLTRKNRYNIERSKRIISEIGKIEFKEYQQELQVQESIERYFALKKITHKKEYGISCKEYYEKYHVTNSYELCLDGEAIAIILSCEQCPIVYIENITYDTEYSKYSPGKLLYDYYLKNLINKNIKTLYLAGGNLEYKKHYGSVEQTTYYCVVYRNGFIRLLNDIIKYVKRILRK